NGDTVRAKRAVAFRIGKVHRPRDRGVRCGHFLHERTASVKAEDAKARSLPLDTALRVLVHPSRWRRSRGRKWDLASDVPLWAVAEGGDADGREDLDRCDGRHISHPTLPERPQRGAYGAAKSVRMPSAVRSSSRRRECRGSGRTVTWSWRSLSTAGHLR